MEWSVDNFHQLPDDVASLTLSLTANDQTRKMWPVEFSAKYEVRIGHRLELILSVTNNDRKSFSFEEALHTYFSIKDVRQVNVTGLEGTTYIDKTDGLKRKMQSGAVTIQAETDRVYLNTRSTCVIDDAGMNRRITVAKRGSDATVIWNPWIVKSKAMADFGDEEWPGMICVESVNAGEHRITLQPGETHEMQTTISELA